MYRSVTTLLGNAWNRMWFQERNTLPLDIVRIGIAFAMLYTYGMFSPYLVEFYTDTGWLPRDTIQKQIEYRWNISVLFYIGEAWQIWVFHGLFLSCCFAMLVGWYTKWVKWFVWLAHLSYALRNNGITYGVDSILSSLLLMMCIAPIGYNLSLDRVRELRRAKRNNLDVVPPRYTSRWGFACIRLIQIQMAVLYFFSSIDKLQGKMWWSGDALWVAVSNFEFNNIPIDWLANHYWLVNLLTYATLIIEMGYFFLIWDKRTRPYFLAGAFFLHIGIALFMGLYFFATVMMAGHIIFLHHDWLAAWGKAWRGKFGNIEMIYDGDCGFCRRSMEGFLAFDGLGQIKTRNFRIQPSPQVSVEQLEEALYVVTRNGRILSGFDAYRYVVLRVPGLWWMVPFFYMPFVSRAIGVPLYAWIAHNRQRLSRWIGAASCKAT